MRGICSKRSEKWFSSAYQVQPFAVVVRTATMASADFCRPIDVPYDASSSRQTDRSPRGIQTTFLPYTCRICSTTLPGDYWALKILALSPGWNCLICDFCSSGRDFAAGSFRFYLAVDTLAVRLTVPVIRVPRGLSPPSHQLDTTSNRMALSRRAPCLAHQTKAVDVLTTSTASDF